jgi:serine/threonine protein kinase
MKMKLTEIPNTIARNLLAQMLSKDPRHRPSLSRILSHPFLSQKSVIRMVGEKAEYDIFISYRVASDKVRHVHLTVYGSSVAHSIASYYDIIMS